jgi:hypothetical protein
MTPPLQERRVTLYQNGVTPEPLEYPHLENVLNWIRTGRYRAAVDRIRSENDRNERAELKKKVVPAVSFSGRFRRRANSELTEHSGLLRLDYDSLKDKDRVKDALKSDGRVLSLFDSVSGPLSSGLSVLVHFDPVPETPEQHLIAFEEARKLFGLEEMDEIVKGVSWLTYLTYDPGLYVNWEAVPIRVDYSKRPEQPKKQRDEYGGSVIPDGEKYLTLRDIGGVLRGVGLSGDMIATALHALHERHGQTVGDPENVEKLARWLGERPYDPETSLSTFRATVIKQLRDLDLSEIASLPSQRHNGGDNGQESKNGHSHAVTKGDKAVTRIIRASDFIRRSFPPVAWIVPNIIPEGLTMLAGKPKTGKSFLAVNVAVAVATGGVAMGKVHVEQGRVLYVNLDSSQREFQKRLKAFGTLPDTLDLAFDWPRLNEGGLDDLAEYIEHAVGLRLVIVDTFKHIRQPDDQKKRLYDQDHESLDGLARLARSHNGIAIIVVHHANKLRDTEDPFDMISGSTGLTASLDTGIVLRQIPEGTGLFVKGKEIQQTDLALTWDEQLSTWILQGDMKEFNLDTTRQAILDAIRAGVTSPQEISDFTEIRYDTVRQALVRMSAGGQLRRVGRGAYGLPKKPEMTWNQGL